MSASNELADTAMIAHAIMRTGALTLIPATAHHIQAELEGNEQFAALLDADVPASWPPGQYDRDAQEFFLQALKSGGDSAVGWFGWYALARNETSTQSALIGCGGYFGPPAEDGTVEIGYSVCPEHRGFGYAKSMSRKLAEHATQLFGVSRVIAHTHPDNPASVAVLTGSGFVQAAVSDQPDTLLFEFTPSTMRTH